jgi:hypothetical protein
MKMCSIQTKEITQWFTVITMTLHTGDQVTLTIGPTLDLDLQVIESSLVNAQVYLLLTDNMLATDQGTWISRDQIKTTQLINHPETTQWQRCCWFGVWCTKWKKLTA